MQTCANMTSYTHLIGMRSIKPQEVSPSLLPLTQILRKQISRHRNINPVQPTVFTAIKIDY